MSVGTALLLPKQRYRKSRTENLIHADQRRHLFSFVQCCPKMNGLQRDMKHFPSGTFGSMAIRRVGEYRVSRKSRGGAVTERRCFVLNFARNGKLGCGGEQIMDLANEFADMKVGFVN